MKYLSKVVLISLLGLMFLGCQEQPVASYVNSPIARAINIDKSLADQIVVVNLISRKRVDSLLEVQLILKNRLAHTSLDALYQIKWFDKDGFVIKSITDTFMPIHLPPLEDKVLSLISSSSKASKYKIVIVDYEKNKKRIPSENIENDN